jgi:para-nitrobenzyl esterase
MKIGVLFVNALCLLSVFNEGKNDLEVETTNGLIEGSQYQWSDGSVVNSWRGIPFAQPPVGDLRWRSPVDHGKWNGTLNCKKLKTSCIQPGGDGKEDCLYLNVYSTANPKNKGPFPVLFYIYGGSLMGGAANSDYGGFVSHAGNGEGIVVVEVSYRLNIFGFLASSELSQEQGGMSGNYGIQDQIRALQWTKDNIANFSTFHLSF